MKLYSLSHKLVCLTLVHGCLALATVGACVSDDGSTASSGSAVPLAGRLAEGVDPARALATLNELKPPIEAPKRTAGLGVLSDRSQRQVTHATDLVSQQRYTEASIALERALRFDPDHPDVHRVLATLHWRAGNIERARTHAARALEGNPDDAVAQYVYGRCQLRDNLAESALVAFRTALLCSDFGRDAETTALTRYHLAELLRTSGYLTAALLQYDHLVTAAQTLRSRGTTTTELAAIISRDGGKTADARASILEKLGRLAEAAASLTDLVTANPDDMALGRRYVRLLAGAGKHGDALAAARRVPAFDDEFISLLIGIYAKTGNPDGVLDDLRGRLVDQPHVPRLAMTLSDVLVKTGRRGEAIETLLTFVSANEDAHKARSRLTDMLLADSRWSDALAVCADGIRVAPDQFDVLSAPILALSSDPLAVESILADAARHADHHIGHFLRGSLALSIGRTKDAEVLLEKSKAEAPEFGPTRILLGRLYLKQYRYDEALTLVGNSDEDKVTDNAALAMIRAQIHDRLDDVPQAMRNYRAVTQLDPEKTEAILAMARLHLRVREPLKAQQLLRSLLDKEPDRDDAGELLGEAYIRGEKNDLATETFKALQARTKSLTVAARCRVRLDKEIAGDLEAQRAILLEALDKGTPDAETWIAIAQTYPTHERDNRRSAFEKALAIEPTQVDIAFWLAMAERSLLDFESCTRRLEELLRYHPNRHTWRHELIGMQTLLFQDDKALALARKPLENKELSQLDREAFRNDVEDVLALQETDDELLKTLRNWVESDSDDSDSKRRLARALSRLKRYAEAAEIFNELLKTDPSNLQFNRQGATSSLRDAGRVDRAEQLMLEWLEDDPANDHTVSLLALHFVLLDRFEEASALTQTHLVQTRNRGWYQGFWVRALNAEKRYSDGVEVAERLLDAAIGVLHGGVERRGPRWRDDVRDEDLIYFPDDPFRNEVIQNRVSVLQLQLVTELIFDKQYQRAEQELSGWIEATTEPRLRARFLLLLSTCYTRQGHFDRAADVMQRVHLLAPNDPIRNNDLAYQWIDRGIYLDKAEPLVRYALGRIPTNAAYLDTFGWLLYKKGEFSEARTWLRRADRARTGGDSVIMDHLGDACWRLGAVEEAIGYWSKAVESIADREGDDLVNDDERRVKVETPSKIEAARSKGSPKIAPLAVKRGESNNKKGDDDA